MRLKQANNDRAQADLARMKPLADKAEISQLQYDAYLAAARVAESDLQASREKLASAQKDAAIKQAAVEAAQTRISEAQAGMANPTPTASRWTFVRRTPARPPPRSSRSAPTSPTPNCSSATPPSSPPSMAWSPARASKSARWSPGQGLMAVVPLADTWVTANFKETQLAAVHTGQRAEIHVDMYGRSVEGRVDSIAGATGARMSLLPPENATGNFVKVVQRIPVKILVDKRDGLVLRPGMNVDVTIFTK